MTQDGPARHSPPMGTPRPIRHYALRETPDHRAVTKCGITVGAGEATRAMGSVSCPSCIRPAGRNPRAPRP